MIELVRPVFVLVICLFAGLAIADDRPLSKQQRGAIRQAQELAVKELTARIKEKPKEVGAYSRRGDAYFFLGDFKKAVADYEQEVKLQPKSASSHWRRGIAYFYAGQYKQAARQFEIYHSFDDVDRENGIWRYFSQFRAYGQKKAREGLLKYKKDDREPFPSVYRLFAGETTGKEILAEIKRAQLSNEEEREKRYFYAHLYIGLNHALENRPKLASEQLKLSTQNKWGPKAGYGPNYMWHVGRLHHGLLSKKNQPREKSKRS
jgi:lipoprotein NlpI